MKNITITLLLIIIVSIIAGSSFYRYNIEIYAHSIILMALFIACALSLIAIDKNDSVTALKRFYAIEITLLVMVCWMLLLIIPMPKNAISLISSDAQDIRTVWVPNSDHATIALYPYRMFQPILTTILSFFVFLVVLLSSNNSNRIYIPTIIIFVAIVQGGMAIFSAITKQQFIDQRLFDGHFGYGRGTFVNKNLFAAYMWFPVCFAIANIWERTLVSRSMGLKGAKNWYFLLVFSLVAMASSYSLGALVVGVILALTIALFFRTNPLSFVRNFSIPIMLCFIATVAILVFQPGSKEWYNRIFDFRADIWRESPRIFKYYWFSGLGGDGIVEMFDIVREWSVGSFRMNTLHTYALDQWMKYGLIYIVGVFILWYQIYNKHIAGDRPSQWQLLTLNERIFTRFAVILGLCLLLHSIISPVFYYICIHFGFICVVAAACAIMIDVKARQNRTIKVVL